MKEFKGQPEGKSKKSTVVYRDVVVKGFNKSVGILKLDSV